MIEDYSWVIAVAAIVVVLVLVWLIAAASRGEGGLAAAAARGRHVRRRRPHRNDIRPEGSEIEPPRKRAAIIINPTKFDDVAAVQRRITAGCERLGWAEPLFVITTEDDPGTGQARAAAAQRVDVVCPLGGDGTVRAVAAALIGTETPMGLLPAGTGNLLARNLELPVDSIESALRVALTGQNLRIDVGRLTIEREADEGASGPAGPSAPVEDAVFLVMAGLGFDAAIMASTPENLKAKVGWPAYVFSGMRNLRGQRFKVSVSADGDTPVVRRTRTVVVGNCGRLLGGITLMPQADITDGLLDAVIISPSGIVGWAAVAGRVITQQRRGHERVDHHTAKQFRIRTDKAQEVEIDGDTIGKAVVITARVQPRALTVRVTALQRAVVPS